MRYMLLTHHAEATEEMVGTEAMEAGRAAMNAYAATLHKAGVLVGAEVLQRSPSTTTLTVSGGALQIQDGPFADTKEQLGGVFVIDVSNLDSAIEWARQVPALQWGGHVEIRPGATYTVDGVWVANE
jgi:hypothetical protein